MIDDRLHLAANELRAATNDSLRPPLPTPRRPASALVLVAAAAVVMAGLLAWFANGSTRSVTTQSPGPAAATTTLSSNDDSPTSQPDTASTVPTATSTDSIPEGLIAPNGWVAPRIGEPAGLNGPMSWGDPGDGLASLANVLPPLVPVANDDEIVIGYIPRDYFDGRLNWSNVPLLDEHGKIIGHMGSDSRPHVGG